VSGRLTKNSSRKSQPFVALVRPGLSRFALAAIVYFAFAVYLYRPYFPNFQTVQYLRVVNACLASLGCYLLSRRWVSGFIPSLFAGAIYGFGPLALGLATKSHAAAGILVAAIPWLFCPAAFANKTRWRRFGIPLSVLPALAIVAFFQASLRFHFFPVPIQLKLHSGDLVGLLTPLIAARRNPGAPGWVGFYHVPMGALVMGAAMLVMARRYAVMAVFAVAATLAVAGPVFGVSPIVWLLVVVLCCSILAGAGMQGLICAGFGDKKWILFTAGVSAAFAIATLLLATKCFQVFLGLGHEYGKLLTEAATMYILGAITLVILFFIVRSKLRLGFLRLLLLSGATALDIFLGATFIMDEIL